jgi:hypothetical protein
MVGYLNGESTAGRITTKQILMMKEAKFPGNAGIYLHGYTNCEDTDKCSLVEYCYRYHQHGRG